MKLSARIQEIRSGFSPTFWVANTLELFERLAFYGTKAILAVFLAEKVGLKNEAGTLTGIFSGVIFSLPILAGVFVDRYGFRRTLIACFFIFSIGYFLIGLAGMEFANSFTGVVDKKTYALTVLLFTAIGGSLIKPCIVGTVAYTSKPSARALGFSIYYTLVNLGGALGPLLALPVRENFGIEYVLVMSSITSFLLMIGTFLFFKEPVSHDGQVEPQRTFGKIFSDMAIVFTNLRFMSFLIIFSGFWIMFWQIFFLLPFYGKDVLGFKQFEILETIDAVCIILFTIPITAAARKLKSIHAMILGFVLATASWFIIGALGTVYSVFIGIALFAFGESMQSPRYYEYVSNLAPKGQVGTFMGFSFLPVAIGAFTAGPISDWLRNTYILTNPSMMWYILSAVGVVSTLLMILYNLFIAPQQTSQD
jgi:proton-dependent oligopeptide transporter, POT family